MHEAQVARAANQAVDALNRPLKGQSIEPCFAFFGALLEGLQGLVMA